MAESYGGPGHAGAVPFVGRAEELGRLDAALTRTGAGGPAVVDVTGEAGIGKSRLLAEFTARARLRGATVLRGRATEYERHTPFQPFADAFSDLDRQALRAFPSLVDLPPELRGAAEPAAGAGARDRFGLYRSASVVLRRVRGARLVIVLDDLHWADPASLELLDHLVRHPAPASPVLLVVSRRDRQAPAALTAALARGAGTGAVQRIPLGPIGERACVEGLADDLPRSRASGIYAASAGNPLYFLALLQAHREERWSGAGPAAPDGGPAAGLEALLLDELAPLGPLERDAVEAAAVLGDRATAETIAAVTGSSLTEVVDALRGAARRDLVRPEPDGRRLALRHPLIRTLVYEATDPWRRQGLHRAAAAALAGAGAPPAERAHHVERSLTGWDPEAAAVLVEAAEQTAQSAPAACAHWLQAVLAILPDTPGHLDRRRELMLRRAVALGTAGALKESRDLFHEAVHLPCRGPADDDLRLAAVVQCAVMERQLGRYAEADALLRRELERRPGPSPSQRVALSVERCCTAQFVARFPRVRDELARTLREARSLGDGVGEMGALTLAAMSEAYEGDTGAARGFARSAAALADTLTDGDLTGLCEPLVRLGWAEVMLDDFAAAERHTDRGVEIARRSGRLYMLSQLLLCKAYVHLLTGRVASALELSEEAAAVARALGSAELLGFTLAVRSLVMMYALPPGDPAVLASAEEAAAEAGSGGSWWSTLARSLVAFAALGAGDPHRARDVLAEAGGGADLPGLQPSLLPEYLELRVAADLAVGDVRGAESAAERALKEAERLGLATRNAAARRALGRVEAHRGDAAAAARAFAEAARESARAGAVLREAQGLLLGAPLARAAGDAAGAAALWRRARRLAAEGGAALLVEAADRQRPLVLGESGGPPEAPGPGSPDPAAALAALTPREREIADLVAEGLTNQAAASRLHLSPRTVESHVARIYRKTGVPSRAALASLVARGAAAGAAGEVREGPPLC